MYEILTKVVSGVSWKDAFMDTLPKRKIFSAKDEGSIDQQDCSPNNQLEENESSVSEESISPIINEKDELIVENTSS